MLPIASSPTKRHTPHWGNGPIGGGAGLGLIETLVKIPIRQFSYRQITNAAFSHVMNLSMDFHIENDSAEVTV
jgi:hypothetical protein